MLPRLLLTIISGLLICLQHILPSHNLFPSSSLSLALSLSLVCFFFFFFFRLKKLWRMLSKSNEIKVLTQLKYPKKRKKKKKIEKQKREVFKTKLCESKNSGRPPAEWVWQVPDSPSGEGARPVKGLALDQSLNAARVSTPCHVTHLERVRVLCGQIGL